MIGFFDSGFGGLKTMRYFHDLNPDYDYMFLADNKNCPFGDKSPKQIEIITFTALNRLFDNGADIVVIACNTAAAYSIRKWQTLHPYKKTLSITVPGVEEIISNNNKGCNNKDTGCVGILATQATVQSNIYTDLYSRFGGKGSPEFSFVMASKLVTMVEEGVDDEDKIKFVINKYLSQFPDNISILVLGCTHFSVYKKYFDELFDGMVIDPSFYSAHKFDYYLTSHPEIEKTLSKKSTVEFYTTGDTQNFNHIGSNLCNKIINSKKVSL